MSDEEKRAEFITKLKALMEAYQVNIASFDEYGGNECYLGKTYEFLAYGWHVTISENLE